VSQRFEGLGGSFDFPQVVDGWPGVLLRMPRRRSSASKLLRRLCRQRNGWEHHAVSVSVECGHAVLRATAARNSFSTIDPVTRRWRGDPQA